MRKAHQRTKPRIPRRIRTRRPSLHLLRWTYAFLLSRKEIAFFSLAVAVRGQIPETLIPECIGLHPERVIGGFTDATKPEGFEWMNSSHITAIFNECGVLFLILAPDQGEAPGISLDVP